MDMNSQGNQMDAAIREAICDAIQQLDQDSADIAISNDFDVLARQPGRVSVRWKSNDELHIGTFLAWSQPADRSAVAQRLIEALSSIDVSVPTIVSSGRSDDTHVVLAQLVDGESMATTLEQIGMRWEISATAFAYARTLARLHALDWTQVVPWMADPESLPEDIVDDQVEAQFERRWHCFKDVPAEWKDFTRRALEWLELRRPVEVSLCLCHGDFRPENIFAVGEDVMAIVNWTSAAVTDASYDLAMLPVWLGELGMSPEEAELFAQAAHGAYLQASPRGLANMPYYSVARPLDQLIERLSGDSESTTGDELNALKGTIERAMALGGRVPWKSR
jgi:aminoglycoside phosphotransferase